jgi:HlyD family secretion protein
MHLQNRTPRRWIALVSLLTTLLLLSGCFWPEAPEEELTFSLPTTFSDVPLAVGTRTYTVERGDVIRTLTLNGTVQAGTQSELYFDVGGPVAAIHVKNGDLVAPGDLLIALDSEDAELSLAEAELLTMQAELRLAQAQTGDSFALEVAQLNLEIALLRVEKLRWNPATSSDDLAVAEREVELAQAAVSQAERGNSGEDSTDVPIAQVQLQIAELTRTRAQRTVDRLQLYAPITGTIRLGQSLRVGFPVEAYTTIATIVDTSSLVIESNLAAEDQEFLYEGMPVQMEVNFLPGVLFPGEISLLPQPYGSGNTPLTQIVPDLSNGNLSLREGAAVTIHAEIGRQENVLWLPSNVIQTVAGRTYVVLNENDKLRDQAVTTGLSGEGRTEILEGLSEGTQVVGP